MTDLHVAQSLDTIDPQLTKYHDDGDMRREDVRKMLKETLLFVDEAGVVSDQCSDRSADFLWKAANSTGSFSESDANRRAKGLYKALVLSDHSESNTVMRLEHTRFNSISSTDVDELGRTRRDRCIAI